MTLSKTAIEQMIENVNASANDHGILPGAMRTDVRSVGRNDMKNQRSAVTRWMIMKKTVIETNAMLSRIVICRVTWKN